MSDRMTAGDLQCTLSIRHIKMHFEALWHSTAQLSTALAKLSIRHLCSAQHSNITARMLQWFAGAYLEASPYNTLKPARLAALIRAGRKSKATYGTGPRSRVCDRGLSSMLTRDCPSSPKPQMTTGRMSLEAAPTLSSVSPVLLVTFHSVETYKLKTIVEKCGSSISMPVNVTKVAQHRDCLRGFAHPDASMHEHAYQNTC